MSGGFIEVCQDKNSLGENDDISPNGPVSDVSAVEGDTPWIVDIASAADLPDARQAWPCLEIIFGIGAVLLQLFHDNRSRSNTAHIAAQDVD